MGHTPIAFFSPSEPGVLFGSQNQCDERQPITLEFLAEGGANVVYRIHGADVPLPAWLSGKLLRLRKEKPFVRPTSEQLVSFSTHFRPLFDPSQTVEQARVRLDQAVLAACNDQLRKLEHSGKRQKRKGDHLAHAERFGLLITDMTPNSDREFAIEFKPKWLLQSPNAPVEAVRCRTCALRARQNAMARAKVEVHARQAVCPLSLVEGDETERRIAVERIVRHRHDKLEDNTVVAHRQFVTDRLVEFFRTEGFAILKELRRHQQSLDPHGILSCAGEPDERFLRAMTLRDCTLFIKIHLTNNGLEARLGDLDLKMAEKGKVAKWRNIERSLLDEGWYAGEDTDSQAGEVCFLRRKQDLKRQ
ncbi:inositol-pentakisphosphate 2-kinase [Cryomyces antarcticus]